MTLNNFLEGNSRINYQEMADGHPTVMKLYAENARLKTKLNAAYTVARGEGIDFKKIGNNVLEFIKKIWNAIKNAYKWIVDKVSDGPINKKEMTKKIEEKGDYNF